MEPRLGCSPYLSAGVELRGATAVEQAARLFGEKAVSQHAALVTPAAEKAGHEILDHETEAFNGDTFVEGGSESSPALPEAA
ncbi:MAG: hypothetical protein ACXWLH_06565 [Candidatus Saccharimonadales bacterium]